MAPSSEATWKPIQVSEIQSLLGDFSGWFLCGGLSIDAIVGHATREHSDIDIGVFRSQLTECLSRITDGLVYLADPPGQLMRWDGSDVEDHVHDVWIASSDESHWILQIVVFTDQGDLVFFKRDRSITWPKSRHTVQRGELSVLNPAITLLYKVTSSEFREKDAADIDWLIRACADRFPY